jgi:hypothetical protein
MYAGRRDVVMRYVCVICVGSRLLLTHTRTPWHMGSNLGTHVVQQALCLRLNPGDVDTQRRLPTRRQICLGVQYAANP